ncbi:DNA replication and repair protein RecO [Flavobacteriaceae bacterium MAR_2010_188]|nr:DNA replication and repair protein RecO [Flavobacteriaceae bacterium MAR_2010_188]
MQNRTKAIVLSKLKYQDHDLIVKCFTLNDGPVSYLLRGVLKSSRGSKKVAYFQPLSQISIDQSFRANQNLRNIKEVKPTVIYQTLHTDVIKGSIVMFVSEILHSVLKEEEPNEDLFEFLETSFQLLDIEENFANFHLMFLLKLTKYLGFYPDTNNGTHNYFNLENGRFENQEKAYYSISGKNLEILKTLLGTNFEAFPEIQLSASQRQSFLTMLLLYFELHLGNFKKPRSLQVFNQIFKK